jgi:hypothetical protein
MDKKMILEQNSLDMELLTHLIFPVLVSFLLSYFIFLAYRIPGISSSSRVLITFMALFFGLADLVLLALLTYLGLSYAPIGSSWLILTIFRLLLLIIPAIVFRLIIWKNGQFSPGIVVVSIGLILILNLISYPYMVRSMYIEPFNLQVSNVPIEVPGSSATRPLKIVQLSDLHVERITQRERDLISQVDALQPDMIVLTGDYINIDYKADPEAQAATRQVLSQFHAPLGVYAVSGSPSVDVPEVVELVLPNLDNITVLEDEIIPIEWQGDKYNLIGMDVDHSPAQPENLLQLSDQADDDAFTILLYHEPSPEMVQAASQAGIDLFLAGHTHGGQFRLPLIGAPMALHPKYFRENDRGLYQIGPTTLYVSSGIGMEGLKMPRFRYNVPPEIVFLELGAKK